MTQIVPIDAQNMSSDSTASCQRRHEDQPSDHAFCDRRQGDRRKATPKAYINAQFATHMIGQMPTDDYLVNDLLRTTQRAISAYETQTRPPQHQQ